MDVESLIIGVGVAYSSYNPSTKDTVLHAFKSRTNTENINLISLIVNEHTLEDG